MNKTIIQGLLVLPNYSLPIKQQLIKKVIENTTANGPNDKENIESILETCLEVATSTNEKEVELISLFTFFK